MKLSLQIDAPGWKNAGNAQTERARQQVLAQALQMMANRLANCGGLEGTIERDEFSGDFTITYEGA